MQWPLKLSVYCCICARCRAEHIVNELDAVMRMMAVLKLSKSGRLVTNDGRQRRNNRPHAGDKLWGFPKNSAYGVSQ